MLHPSVWESNPFGGIGLRQEFFGDPCRMIDSFGSLNRPTIEVDFARAKVTSRGFLQSGAGDVYPLVPR